MFSVPDIIVSNNTAFNGNLYPSRIFEWKISGINCAAEDYTIGGTNTWTVSFKTDVKIDTSATLTVSGYSMTITQNARVDDSKNFYTITAIPEKTFELDEFLDDAFIEYDQPETLSHLMGRLGWVNSETGLPYDYVINSKWASQGMTKRQVIGFICQLLGANMSSWMVATPTLFTLNNPNSTVKQYTPSNVKKITITDYSAPGIDKIWFGTDGTDVGIAYGTGTQQLTLPYNPLIDPDSADNTALLQYIYSKVSGNSYHPVKLNTFLDEAPSFSELTGYITVPTISYTDEDNNTYAFPIFNWEVSQGGCSLEANGNADRSVANQVLSSEIAQNGKYNKFKRTLDSTVSEIANLQGDVSSLNQTAASLTTQVASKVGEDEIISKINQTAETITINASKINLSGAVAVSSKAQGGSESESAAEADSLTAMLTIEPTSSQMTSDYSRSGLYCNTFSISKYNTSGTRYANARMYADSLQMGATKITDPATQNWYRYNTVNARSAGVSDSNYGYGQFFLFNPEAMRVNGATTNDSCIYMTSNASNDGQACGAIQLYSRYGSTHWPNIYFMPYGYQTGAEDFARIDQNAYSIYNTSQGSTRALAHYTKDGVRYLNSYTSGRDTYIGKNLILVGDATTTAYGAMAPSYIGLYDVNNKPRFYANTLNLQFKDSAGTTTVNVDGSSKSFNLYSGTTPVMTLSTNTLSFKNSGGTETNKVVATGASVIEHGTKTVGSQVWEYRKWSNGDYECWTKIPEASRVFEGWNQPCIVSKYSVGGLTYPVTFTEAPHEHVTPFGGNSVMLIEDGTNNTTTTSRKYQGVRPRPDSGFISGTTAFSFGLDFYVKGKVSV